MTSDKTNWINRKIGDLPVALIDGDRSSKYPKRSEFQPSGIPFLNGASLESGRLNLQHINYISQQKFDQIHKGRTQPLDLLMTTRGNGVGNVALFQGPYRIGLINAQMLIIRPDNKFIDPRFLLYLFCSDNFQSSVNNYASGSAQPQLPIRDLREISISLPPLPTQKKIASVLSTYDDLIENNERRIKILEEMAQSIYQEWFVNYRFPGHENVKMVCSELGEIPETWEVLALKDVCTRITDGSHSSPASAEEGYPMASVKDMTDWGLDESTCRTINQDDYDKLVTNNCKPLLNDILIAKDGSYLKHAFVVDGEKELVVLSSIAILRPNTDAIFPQLLCQSLRQPHTKARLAGYVSGVAIPRIILKDFANFPVVVPPMKVQQRYSDVSAVCVEMIRKTMRQNANLRRTRDLLLPKLISGELDVSQLIGESI